MSTIRNPWGGLTLKTCSTCSHGTALRFCLSNPCTWPPWGLPPSAPPLLGDAWHDCPSPWCLACRANPRRALLTITKYGKYHQYFLNTKIIRQCSVILRMLEFFISHLADFLRHLPLAYTQTYLEPLRFSSCRCWLFDLSILEWSRIPGWQKLRTVWNSLVLVVTPLNTSKRGCWLISSTLWLLTSKF